MGEIKKKEKKKYGSSIMNIRLRFQNPFELRIKLSKREKFRGRNNEIKRMQSSYIQSVEENS